jgi:hypothetical protein
MVGKLSIVAIFGLSLIGLVLLDYFDLISLSLISSIIFGELLKYPILIFVPLAIMVFFYSLNFFYLKSRLYPEEIVITKARKLDSLSDIHYLKTLGLTGHLVSLDLRMIWRHKRTRSLVYMAPLFLGYGFFFYPVPIYREMYGFLIFVGIFMTGGMMLNYLNYCFSYESNYFDNILVNYRDFDHYLWAKYIFGITIAVVSYILTIPYVFFGSDILLLNTMTFLYNIGFLSFVLFYLSTFSKKRMDLSKAATFNYQGLGASHWLSMLPAFLLPVFIYLPFSWLGYSKAGLLFIGALGLAGLLFHRSMFEIVKKQFLKRRYEMAEGFRE